MEFRSVLVLLSIISIAAYAQDLPGFHSTYQSALRASTEENKILMIDFYTSWCGPCKKLDKEVYGSEDFYPYTQMLACVKVDFETKEGAELGKEYDVSTFPTVVFIDPQGNEIERITSYFAKGRYMKDVNRIIEGEYTIGAMEAKFPDQTTYKDLFHLSVYFGRRYFNKKKRDRYHQALMEMDPQMKQDSTILLTNVLYQSQLILNDGSDLIASISFINNHPAKPYQAELMWRIVKYLDSNDQKEKARKVFESFSAKFDPKGDKEVEKYLRQAKKIIK